MQGQQLRCRNQFRHRSNQCARKCGAERDTEDRVSAFVKKGKRKPECHPNRAHYAKGLCASCYHAQAKKKKTQQHKQPVRVIHTHEIIRQVQQPEEKHTMAAAHDEKEVKAEPLKRAEGASKESVVSLAGTTEPTVELGGDGVTPK